MNKKRLLNVAKALREAPNPKQFTMLRFGRSGANRCGTPCCALGHYAARKDLQQTFALNANGQLCRADDPRLGFIGIDNPLVQEHFDISLGQTGELFDSEGCDSATTVERAAQYIENFVKRDGRTDL